MQSGGVAWGRVSRPQMSDDRMACVRVVSGERAHDGSRAWCRRSYRLMGAGGVGGLPYGGGQGGKKKSMLVTCSAPISSLRAAASAALSR